MILYWPLPKKWLGLNWQYMIFNTISSAAISSNFSSQGRGLFQIRVGKIVSWLTLVKELDSVRTSVYVALT